MGYQILVRLSTRKRHIVVVKKVTKELSFLAIILTFREMITS